jgi:hypothetical protein
MIERSCLVNNRKLAQLEKKVPELAVAALDAASQRAAASGLPRVVLIDNSLFRISPSGARELIRTLPPQTSAPSRAGRSEA